MPQGMLVLLNLKSASILTKGLKQRKEAAVKFSGGGLGY
jgi:hypothetical protein